MPETAQSPVSDRRRLAAVHATHLLDTAPEEAFDRLTRLAARVLGASAAFITLVDETRSFWKSRTGVDGDATENPLADSFCQYVIASGAPLITGDAATDPITRDNPSIASMGIAAWAGMPVHSPDGQVLGTFCVVDQRVREWTSDDLEVLSALAEAATGEIALRDALDRASLFARTLQQSLLPPAVPEVEGLDVAAAHRPARDGFGVLGDFYDVFETVPNRWFVTLGDVCGHGPTAAETAVSARWTIRAAAARTHHPSSVLESLNRQMARRPEDEAPHLTAVLLSLDATARADDPTAPLEVALTTAGHPPPVLRRADGALEQLYPAGRPLGMFDDAALTVETLTLRPGDALVLVTDGATEARDAEGRLMGEEGVVAAVFADARHPDETAAELTDRVIAATRAHQDGPLVDDVAVVVLRVPPA